MELSTFSAASTYYMGELLEQICIPEEEEEFDLSAMDYMDSVALELAI